ncbi:MAG: hypothetical protein LBL46_00170 [Rickettsiales bacterium]|jgi:hypothetical protein|nr:hypothetical protein [Rickettsiales bacterium]
MKKLIAILALAATAADAAKLCRAKPTGYSYYSRSTPEGGGPFNLATAKWAMGSGCTGLITDGGRDVASYCTTRVASGVSACIDAVSAVAAAGNSYADGWGLNPLLVNEGVATATGNVCFCKMTWPYEGKWVFREEFNLTSTQCARWCPSSCSWLGIDLF